MEYGFTSINGQRWLDSWVDIYNNCKNLDERNRFFKIACGMISVNGRKVK